MNETELVRARRRREALDCLALEREREEALLPRLEHALRDANAWRIDEQAFAKMPPDDASILRELGFQQDRPEPDVQARLDAAVAELAADLEECRRRQLAYQRYAEALDG